MVLGHTRLAIIDFAGGSQPFVSSDGRYRLTYNGEIYNYAELRRELQLRYAATFRTLSDTEVMLVGLMCEGSEFLERVNGMFAFAFADNSAGTLLLGRDRFGKKPLFFRTAGNCFEFASELSALPGGTPRDINEAALLLYLLYGYIPAPQTIYPSIACLEPGTCLRVTPGEDRFDLAVERWLTRTIPTSGSAPDWAAAIEDALVSAVRDRLTAADVEVGCFLSGGVDSSLIAALATQAQAALHTFSVGFSEASFDESEFALRVASQIGSTHHPVTVDTQAVPEIATRLLRNHGQPYADSSMIPTYVVSRAAADFVKVVLSGDGADELFGGYRRYVSTARVTRIEGLTRLSLGWVASVVAAPRLGPQQRTALRAQGWRRYAAMCEVIPRAILAQSARAAALLADVAPVEADLFGAGDPVWKSSYVAAVRWCDLHRTYLPNDILPKVDRSSMAASLEVRCPFLDPRVVGLAWQLPEKEMINAHEGKLVLKKVARHHVPREVLARQKMGFSIPLATWMSEPLNAVVREDLDRSDLVAEYLDEAFLRKLLTRGCDHLAHATILWTAWMLSRWEHEFL